MQRSQGGEESLRKAGGELSCKGKKDTFVLLGGRGMEVSLRLHNLREKEDLHPYLFTRERNMMLVGGGSNHCGDGGGDRLQRLPLRR